LLTGREPDLPGPVRPESENRARTDEGVYLDGDARPLRELDYRRDVARDRASCACGLDPEFVLLDFLAELQALIERSLRTPRKTDVRYGDAEVVHQVYEPELLVDARIRDGRILQPISQGLVHDGDAIRNRAPQSIELVPIVH